MHAPAFWRGPKCCRWWIASSSLRVLLLIYEESTCKMLPFCSVIEMSHASQYAMPSSASSSSLLTRQESHSTAASGQARWSRCKCVRAHGAHEAVYGAVGVLQQLQVGSRPTPVRRGKTVVIFSMFTKHLKFIVIYSSVTALCLMLSCLLCLAAA